MMNVGAQDAANRVKLRALLHDPLKPFTELYVLGESAKLERLNLALEGLTTAQTVTLTNGTLSLFSSATIAPEKPLENLVATTTVRDEVKHAILLIVPAPATEKLPYKIMVINDAFNTFPKGESRVLNMTKLPLAVKIGEHSKEVAAASFVAIPAVTKVNDMNQAQTIFYQKVDTEWSLLSERPTQFTKDIRHVFLLYQMPNVEEPQIRTILDTATE
jgi:hypothetical protein